MTPAEVARKRRWNWHWIAFLVGLLVAMIAHNAGVEWWRAGWMPGDAADLGGVSALLVLAVRAELEKQGG